MSDLKPCAHCGCAVELAEVGRSWWRIQAVNMHDDECPVDREYDCSQSVPVSEFIEWWNDRPIEDQLRAELVQIKAVALSLLEIVNCEVYNLDTDEFNVVEKAKKLLGGE